MRCNYPGFSALLLLLDTCEIPESTTFFSKSVLYHSGKTARRIVWEKMNKHLKHHVFKLPTKIFQNVIVFWNLYDLWKWTWHCEHCELYESPRKHFCLIRLTYPFKIWDFWSMGFTAPMFFFFHVQSVHTDVILGFIYLNFMDSKFLTKHKKTISK